MRILCICQGGNCRSVALGYLLKYGYGHDALSCSIEKNSYETKDMLFQWADKIYLLTPEFLNEIPHQYQSKMELMDLGPDKWSNGLWPELHQELINRLQHTYEPSQTL